MIEVPLFNSARVEAVLNDIKVNTDKQLIGGNVESTLNPNGPFILDKDEVIEELSEEGTGEQTENADNSFEELPDTDIDIEGEIADVEYNETDSTITVTDTEGNTTDIDPETADENEDGDIVIEDGKGNVYVVDENGEVSGPHQSSPDTITEDTPIDFMVQFMESENQQYGFDFKQHEALSSEYEQMQINGENYSIPWKSIKMGSTDPITAKISGKDEFPDMIGFRNLSSNLATTPSESPTEKTVTLQTTTEEEEITAYVLQEITNEKGEKEEESITVGKLKVKQYEQIRKNIVLVQVNDADVPSPSLLQDELNSIYGSAVVEWDVNAAEPYEVSEEDLETLDEGESGMFASFPQNMRKFNRKFKRNEDNFDKDAYYLFVIEGDYSDKAGIMPFKRQFGYIFKDNVDNINKTIAHELAHGAFRLRHTFSEEGFIASQNSTYNLMDYRPDGTDLYKHQWDLVHDPESMIGWFEDDEEGEMDAGLEYNYVVAVEDAWKRKEITPYDFISPTEVILPGHPIGLVDTLRVNESTLVAKIKMISTSNYLYTTYSNLEKVVDIEEKEFYIPKSDTALSTPYGIKSTDQTASYSPGDKIIVNKECGKYFKVKSTGSTLIEGHWFEKSHLMEKEDLLSETELALVDKYKSSMSSDVSSNYLGFVFDFRKDGYFDGEKEPLTWLEEQDIENNEITFLGLKVKKIITPFKEVLEKTEKNFKADYKDVYDATVAQLAGSDDLTGQAEIRYIANDCNCNPSNHSLGAAIDIRPALNPQITSSDKAYIAFIKYITGLDLTKPKTDQQVVTAQELVLKKIHGQKTKKYSLKEIITDFKLINAMNQEFDLLIRLKEEDLVITDFQTVKADLLEVLNAHKNRAIFGSDAKNAIDDMVNYLNSVTSGNTIPRNSIANWNKVTEEKKAFLDMVKEAGFNGLDKFIEYFGKTNGQLLFKNKLLEYGFGELPIELVKSFHKAHQTVSLKYNGASESGEWGGSYSYKYDGMHFGLKTSFIKALTNK